MAVGDAFDAQRDETVNLAEIVSKAEALKASGNAEFARGTTAGYTRAHELYSQAIFLFPDDIVSASFSYDDGGVLLLYENIGANRVLCSRRLEDWHRVIEEATAVIGGTTNILRKSSPYLTRALHARCVAYENLKRYDTALLDFYAVSRSFRERSNWTELSTLNQKVDTLERLVDTSTTDANLVWKRLTATGTPPGPRVFHTTVSWEGKLFLYGGRSDLSNPSNGSSADIWILDCESMHWTRKATTGTRNSGCLDSHSASVHDGKMYVFGGEVINGGGHITPPGKGFFALDLKTLIWTRVKQNTVAPPRVKSHSSFFYKRKFYVIGGEHEHDEGCYGPNCKLEPGFYSFNFTTGKWRKERLPVSDDCPEATALAASAVCVKGDRLVVYGGRFWNSGAYSGDLFFYDFTEQKWSNGRSASGPWPLPRGEVTAVTLGNGVVFHGGYLENPSFGSRYLSDGARLYVGSDKVKWQRAGKMSITVGREGLGFGRGEQDSSPGCRAASSLSQIASSGEKRRAILFGGYETLSFPGAQRPILDDLWELTVTRRRRSTGSTGPADVGSASGV